MFFSAFLCSGILLENCTPLFGTTEETDFTVEVLACLLNVITQAHRGFCLCAMSDFLDTEISRALSCAGPVSMVCRAVEFDNEQYASAFVSICKCVCW